MLKRCLRKDQAKMVKRIQVYNQKAVPETNRPTNAPSKDSPREIEGCLVVRKKGKMSWLHEKNSCSVDASSHLHFLPDQRFVCSRCKDLLLRHRQ